MTRVLNALRKEPLSGETRSVVVFLHGYGANGADLLGMADPLAEHLPDTLFVAPDAPEACAIGMAPTTSTTLTLALGDALAVALMERRGFQPEHFATFHPGGKLGAQMATVAQIMHGPERVPQVGAEAPMADALREMSAKGFGMTAVVENGFLAGIVTDGDLRRHLDKLGGATAGDVATKGPITVGPQELAVSALAILNEKKINVLIVVDDDNRPVGILHIHDLLRAGVA